MTLLYRVAADGATSSSGDELETLARSRGDRRSTTSSDARDGADAGRSARRRTRSTRLVPDIARARRLPVRPGADDASGSRRRSDASGCRAARSTRSASRTDDRTWVLRRLEFLTDDSEERRASTKSLCTISEVRSRPESPPPRRRRRSYRTQPSRRPRTRSSSTRRSDPDRPDRAARAGIVAGAAFLFVVGAVAAMGASPSPSTGADPRRRDRASVGTAPAASAAPDDQCRARRHTGPAPARASARCRHAWRFGGFGFGFRDITITAINGSDLSLKTDDGWTRTITVTSTTTITKGGATITVGDLAVGDQIAFAQDRADDGTYSVTAIKVDPADHRRRGHAPSTATRSPSPSRGGTTATIHVDGDTTYQVNGAAGALSDIKVGSFIAAEGTQRSRRLARCRSRAGGRPWHQGPGLPGRPARAEGSRTPAPPRRAAPADRPAHVTHTRGAGPGGPAPLSILTSFSAGAAFDGPIAAPRDLQHDRSFR